MMTFLPYADFRRSAAALDDRRLGKQRVEVLTILRVLERGGGAWFNHPAARMWDGYPEALAAYGVAVTREWRRRGHRDTCLGKIAAFAPSGAFMSQRSLRERNLLPPWLGDHRLHVSHQSSLVRKNPSYYRRAFPRVRDDLPCFWPTKSGG